MEFLEQNQEKLPELIYARVYLIVPESRDTDLLLSPFHSKEHKLLMLWWYASQLYFGVSKQCNRNTQFFHYNHLCLPRIEQIVLKKIQRSYGRNSFSFTLVIKKI